MIVIALSLLAFGAARVADAASLLVPTLQSNPLHSNVTCTQTRTASTPYKGVFKGLASCPSKALVLHPLLVSAPQNNPFHSNVACAAVGCSLNLQNMSADWPMTPCRVPRPHHHMRWRISLRRTGPPVH